MNLPIRPPVIVHHMAALEPGYVPNSLKAVRACLENNAAVIEIDVTALATDDFLLVHDPYLESETNGFGPVQALMPAKARQLHYKQRGQVTGEPVALLQDVVKLFLDASGTTRLQIDWKDVIPFPNAEPYERLIRLIKPLGERVIVSTGADWQLRRLRRLAPWLDLGFDIGNH